MKEKIINIKNILRIIISVLIIFSMFKSCAKALTMSAINEMILDTKNSTKASYYKTAMYNCTMQSNVQNLLSQQCGNYNNILIQFNGNDSAGHDQFNYYLYNEPNRINVGSDYRVNMTTNCFRFASMTNYNNTYNQSTGNQSIYFRVYYSGNNNNGNYMAITGITIGDISNVGSVRSQFLGWTSYSPLQPLEYTSSLTEGTHNGSLFTWYYQGDFYGNENMQLGSITLNDSYYYEVRLRESNSQVVKGTIFYDLESNTTLNDGAIYQDSDKNIYVTTRLLNYSTQYQLEIESYYRRRG